MDEMKLCYVGTGYSCNTRVAKIFSSKPGLLGYISSAEQPEIHNEILSQKKKKQLKMIQTEGFPIL